MNQQVQLYGVNVELYNDLPESTLQNIADSKGFKIDSVEFAKYLDENDKLRHLKDEFILPQIGQTTIRDAPGSLSGAYFAGNKIGPQPKKTASFVLEIMKKWEKFGVECYWDYFGVTTCEENVEEQLARLVGAKQSEITAMNTMEVNLHLMLVSFYRPTANRHKILMDSRDVNRPILESHIESRGHNVKDSLIFLDYKPGKYTLDIEEILRVVEEKGDSIATIFLPCILPTSGQLLEVERITKCGHEKGSMVGFSMDDAVGNVELQLNKWQVDFACWNTGKYLNSGPRAIGCAFIHEKHDNNDWPKFSGWWGHKYSSRFQMTNKMDLVPGVRGYRLSNQPPTFVAMLKVSLDIFDRTSAEDLRGKRYLEYLIKLKYPRPKVDHRGKIGIEILTPCSFQQRGSQLSLRLTRDMKNVQKELKKRGFICDCYPPDVLTVTPAPLYCGFVDVFNFVTAICDITESL